MKRYRGSISNLELINGEAFFGRSKKQKLAGIDKAETD